MRKDKTPHKVQNWMSQDPVFRSIQRSAMDIIERLGDLKGANDMSDADIKLAIMAVEAAVQYAHRAHRKELEI